MVPTKRAMFTVAAQLFFAFSSLASADPSPVPAGLVEELHKWIDMATDLPPSETQAKIVLVDPEEIARPSAMTSMIGRDPRGLYDPDTGTITLVRPWSSDNPRDVSVLLHELVHHRQEGTHFYCEAAKEHAAYKMQAEWLAERDLDIDVNWIAVVLASSCTVRDIHP